MAAAITALGDDAPRKNLSIMARPFASHTPRYHRYRSAAR
jgi:hypothetical protein